MYQGKFDSKNKRTTVDVSQLVAQRNSAPSQEQPPASRCGKIRRRPTLPGRSSPSVSKMYGRVSQPGSPAESGRPRLRRCRKSAAKDRGWVA